MNSSTSNQNAKLISSDSTSLCKSIQSKIRWKIEGKIETKNASRKELLCKLEGTESELGNTVVCISARRQEWETEPQSFEHSESGWEILHIKCSLA